MSSSEWSNHTQYRIVLTFHLVFDHSIGQQHEGNDGFQIFIQALINYLMSGYNGLSAILYLVIP